jgi:hypothetical protein
MKGGGARKTRSERRRRNDDVKKIAREERKTRGDALVPVIQKAANLFIICVMVDQKVYKEIYLS